MQESTLLAHASPRILSASTRRFAKDLIERFCLRDDLATYDPYDIWKTPAGFRVKKLYNAHPAAGLFPAAALSLFDCMLNQRARLFYRPMEYAVVRAVASQCLLNLFEASRDERYILYARRHLQWLTTHRCGGYDGDCWGLGFAHAVTKDIVYSADTPFTTITPYALEAFVRYAELTCDSQFNSYIDGVRRFFDNDVAVMEEDDDAIATSYGPFHDRTVINAVSYAMYSYALLSRYAAERHDHRIATRIRKLYAYVCRHQRSDGSWLYSPQGRSFIDCFHSCIVLKNIVKTARLFPLEDAAHVIRAGFDYLKNSFLDDRRFLFCRFTLRNKYNLVRFDLYDNAEALNIAILVGDLPLAEKLLHSILNHFCRGVDIYSQMDLTGRLMNKNTLRWAVMPFLYSVSQIV